jgi:hypothetical protein
MKKAEVYQRNQKILQLRQEGLSIRAIAAQIPCAKSTAARIVNNAAEMAKLSPSLSVSFDTSPDELARQIHLLLGERFLKKLGQCLRQEVPLSVRETYELVQEVTTVQERYCLAALLAGDRYRLG